MKTFLTPAQLAERYAGRVSVKTLANWRCLGKGPRFLKVGGRIAYALDDVAAWEASRTADGTPVAQRRRTG